MKTYKLKTKSRTPGFDPGTELNEEQKNVIFAEGGPLLVIAGAGSGKTRTLTYRVARLVYDGVSVQRILLCTFTNKAAREMTNRVSRLIHRSTEELWGGTFHHIANRILRREIEKMGYGFNNNFTILDREDSNQLINASISDLGFSQRGRRFPKGRVLSSLFGLCRSTQQQVYNLIPESYPKFEPITHEIEEVWQRYQERKERLNVLDFDDLLHYLHQVLHEFHDIRAYYSEFFQHVLVDEYQDVNPLQAEIVDLLSSHHKNLTAVGDDAQSIYSFRGADSQHILTFPERYENCNIHYLTKNYRSRPEILEVGNRVITYNSNQYEKQLTSERTAGDPPVLVMAQDTRQEAEFVAQRIKELQSEEGIPLSEIAILYRIHSHSLELQMALQQQGIPFIVRSGIRFFEQAHIKDVVSFLRIIQNKRDELSWRRLLPIFPGIGPASVKKIWEQLDSNEHNVEALQDKKWLKKLAKAARNSVDWLIRLIKEAEETEQQKQPALTIQNFYEQEYKDHLEHTYDNAVKRGEDLLQLANLAASYSSVGSFLDDLMLLNDNELLFEDEGGKPKDEDAVILSTIHQAKGLEWQVVFTLNLTENNFPFIMAIQEENIEEERRLFYVASTRAKDQLYLIYPRMFQHRSWGWRTSKPSRFLWETLHPPTEDKQVAFGNFTAFKREANSSELFDAWQLEEESFDDEEAYEPEEPEEDLDF